MASKAKTGPAVFVARQGFYVDGTLVPAGATVVAGHPLLKGKGRMQLFEPFQPTFGKLEYGEIEAPVIAAAEAAEPEPKQAKPEPEVDEDEAGGGA
jgi:hypothetical protein